MKGGGTLCTKFALAGLGTGLSGFRSFSKKWTDQSESEEKSHCYSRAFFLKRKARRLKMAIQIRTPTSVINTA